MAVFNFEAIRRHNSAFIANVTAGLNRIPAELTAVYAVNVLELAISKAVTKHDSSRFASIVTVIVLISSHPSTGITSARRATVADTSWRC